MKTKLLTICLLLLTSQVFADNQYLRCDSTKFKISEPLIGFKKAYIEIDGKWKKMNTEFLEDKIIINNDSFQLDLNCKDTKKCKFKLIISKLREPDDLYEAYVIAKNECSLKDKGECRYYKPGDIITEPKGKTYCSKLKLPNE